MSDATANALGMTADGRELLLGAHSGLFRSEDGGQSWRPVVLSARHPHLDVMAVTPHPEEARTIYVATHEAGVFKTTDGGRTWKKVLYVDEKTGAADLAETGRDDDEGPDALRGAFAGHVERRLGHLPAAVRAAEVVCPFAKPAGARTAHVQPRTQPIALLGRRRDRRRLRLRHRARASPPPPGHAWQTIDGDDSSGARRMPS